MNKSTVTKEEIGNVIERMINTERKIKKIVPNMMEFSAKEKMKVAEILAALVKTYNDDIAFYIAESK